MKNILSSLLILLFIAFGCKTKEVNSVPQIDYLSSPCKLSSFSFRYFSRNVIVSTVYNSQNQLTELVAKELVNFTSKISRKMQYENGQLKKVIRNYEDYPNLTPDPIKNQSAAEYEYGEYGVEKIHLYEGSGHETEYYEFQYSNGPKPVGMSYFMNMSYTEEKFILALKSTFEYDSNGNLTKEIIENIAGLGGSHETRTKMYFYDDKINTVKKLSYIYFDTGSPALVLSTNNVIKIKTIYPSNDYEQNVSVKYDSNGNSLWAPIEFSNVVWDCQ